ncbi:hypothetical protein V2W45_1179509, partial [Cenococcum geophilum]
IGYRLILGGTRYYGYYLEGTKWPFLITRALREIKDHLFKSLDLSAGATILDTGYKVGHIIIRIATKELRVFGINIVNYYLIKASKNIKAANLKQQISTQKIDYHSLNGLYNNLINGVYTIEILIY